MLVVVLIIGLGWEMFEISINKFITQKSFNLVDSVSDIFFDLAGGLFAIFYFLKHIMSINKTSYN